MTAASGSSRPDDVAAAILALGRPLLVVFDCDGVLAPLVDHADDSVLSDGVGSGLATLAGKDDITVAILSGRSLDGLAQFDFDDSIAVAGSYGGERRGAEPAPLDGDEQTLLDRIDEITVAAAEMAGGGAWVERKPTSVVLHVREADDERGRNALEHVRREQAVLEGHECHEGSNVVELMARPTDKGRGLDQLRTDFGAVSTVYLGDDIPDEDAFAVLGDRDLSVRVGPGDTGADLRLDGPDDVAAMIAALSAG